MEVAAIPADTSPEVLKNVLRENLAVTVLPFSFYH
jgi:hypothetical protein